MSKLRWSKLWWQDWSEDPALRLCSFAAQGLWMRMLCISASQHDDLYGYVLVNGKPPTTAQLAKIVGGHHTTVAALLRELERNGVTTKTADNTYTSRRQLRDKLETKAKQEAGKRGGNPALIRPRQPVSAESVLKQEVKPQDKLEAEAEAEADKESAPQPPAERGERAADHSQSPRKAGTAPRTKGTNPRAKGTTTGSTPRASRNGFTDITTEMMDDGEARDAHRQSAVVVLKPRSARGC